MMQTEAPSAIVFAKLSDVVVPAGTAPGSSFSVQVKKVVKGRERNVVHTLWAGCGAAPAVQQRAVRAAVGPRHALRPSALAT